MANSKNEQINGMVSKYNSSKGAFVSVKSLIEAETDADFKKAGEGAGAPFSMRPGEKLYIPDTERMVLWVRKFNDFPILYTTVYSDRLGACEDFPVSFLRRCPASDEGHDEGYRTLLDPVKNPLGSKMLQASLFSNDLDRIKAIAGKWITCTAEIKAEFRQFSDRKWDGKSYYSRICCLLAEAEEPAKQK